MPDLPFDPTKNAKEIVDELRSKGLPVNISIDGLILVDYDSQTGREGYKIFLAAPYPDGHPYQVVTFKPVWKPSID